MKILERVEKNFWLICVATLQVWPRSIHAGVWFEDLQLYVLGYGSRWMDKKSLSRTEKMKNHRLPIMAPHIDIVHEMMAQLDEVSQDVPEGFYLQFCGHLKRLHEMGEPPRRPRVRRGIPARIRTAAERRADDEVRRAADRAGEEAFWAWWNAGRTEYRPTSPARHPRL